MNDLIHIAKKMYNLLQSDESLGHLYKNNQNISNRNLIVTRAAYRHESNQYK